jgi:hypothetical protein
MAWPRNKSYFVSQRCIRGRDAALRRPRDSYVQETAQCAVATIYEIASSRLIFTVRRPSTLARGREPY